MEHNLITKSNQLIQTSYSLSIAEQRLLFSCLSQIDSRGELDLSKPVKLTVSQAQDLFYNGENRYNAYKELKKACERLYQREIRIKDKENKVLILTRWVHTAKFSEEDQSATLHFTDTLEPYISSLVNNFTQYRLGTIAQLTNKYASRIYELILMWHNNDIWQAEKMNTKAKTIKEIEIDEFRFLLDLTSKYKQFNELKKYVVEPCVKQINENTDMNLTVQFKRSGRSYRHIQLAYEKKPSEKTIEPINHHKDTWKEKGLSDKQIERIGNFESRRRLFLSENLAVIEKLGVSTMGKDEKPLFDEVVPLLKDPELVRWFKSIKECLDMEA